MKTSKVSIHKLTVNENTFSSDLKNCDTLWVNTLEVGSRMVVTSSSNAREGISTSAVQKIFDVNEKTKDVHTMNSIYRLEFLDE